MSLGGGEPHNTYFHTTIHIQCNEKLHDTNLSQADIFSVKSTLLSVKATQLLASFINFSAPINTFLFVFVFAVKMSCVTIIVNLNCMANYSYLYKLWQ